MKNLIFTGLLLLIFLPGDAEAQARHGRNEQVIRLGVSTRTFPAANRNDAQAALKVWAAAVLKDREIQEDAQILLHDSVEELRAAYERGSLDALSVTVEEIMLLGINPDFVYIPVKDQGFHVRYVVLVHRDGVITAPADFMNHKMAFVDNEQMVLAIPWLETLLAGGVGQPVDRGRVGLITVENPSKAILQVFFRQAQAALVTLEAFELACELNPQLRRELMVLHESPPFVAGFFFFRPGWLGITRERIEEAVLNLHSTPGGQQVLTVFQSSGMSKQPGSVLDSTRQFIIKHRRLTHDSPSREGQP